MRGVRSDGWVRSFSEHPRMSDEREEQVPFYGSMCGVGISKGKMTEKRKISEETMAKKIDKPESEAMESGVRSDGWVLSYSKYSRMRDEYFRMRDEREQQVPFDGPIRGIGITKRPANPEKGSNKVKMTKKRKISEEKGSNKVKMTEKRKISEETMVKKNSDEVKMKGMAGVGVTNLHKPKSEEAEMKMEGMLLDSGSKVAGKRTKLIPEAAVDFYVSDELAQYMLCKPLRTVPLCTITKDIFGADLDQRISALFKKDIEFKANVLRQYRINGYVDAPPEEQDTGRCATEEQDTGRCATEEQGTGRYVDEEDALVVVT